MQKKIISKNLIKHFEILKKDKNQIINQAILIANLILDCFKNKGKLLIFGNGGSAADAQHFATELTFRLKKNRVALPAIALTTDTSAITAIGNDFSFNDIFKRQIEAIVGNKDLIIPITNSGNSKNIISAIKFSKKKKLKVFGILGNKGGIAKKFCNNHFIASDKNSSRIQEIHIIFWQNVCELVEKAYVNKIK